MRECIKSELSLPGIDAIHFASLHFDVTHVAGPGDLSERRQDRDAYTNTRREGIPRGGRSEQFQEHNYITQIDVFFTTTQCTTHDLVVAAMVKSHKTLL